MTKRTSWWSAFGLLLLAAAFVAGLGWFLHISFAIGSEFSPNSSLRSDPLGTRVYYDSLGARPGVTTRRHTEGMAKIVPTRSALIVYAGLDRFDLSEVDAKAWNSLLEQVKKGSRLVLLYNGPSISSATRSDKNDEIEEPTAKKAQGEEPASDRKKVRDFVREGKDPEEKSQRRTSALHELTHRDVMRERVDFLTRTKFPELNFTILNRPLPLSDNEDPLSVIATRDPAAPGELEREVPWFSPGVLDNLDEKWHVLYTRDRKPVLVERAVGEGSIVVGTDTYFITNQALFFERRAGLLNWLHSGKHEVIFDEGHLGLNSSPGIMALMRRYHFEGAFAGLILLALLFVWRNSRPLVPPYALSVERDTGETVIGRDAMAGLVNLLRRNIPPSRLLSEAVEVWNASQPHRDSDTGRARRTQLSEALKTDAVLAKKNPVEMYRRLCEMQKRK